MPASPSKGVVLVERRPGPVRRPGPAASRPGPARASLPDGRARRRRRTRKWAISDFAPAQQQQRATRRAKSGRSPHCIARDTPPPPMQLAADRSMTAARSAAGPRHSAAPSKNNGSFIRTPPRRGENPAREKVLWRNSDGQHWTSIIIPSRSLPRRGWLWGDSCQTTR
ncbi:hypothetical protein MTO96_020980 [Rhipicephalus appendiculatus]